MTLTFAATHDAYAVEPDVAILTDQSYTPMSHFIVDAPPLDGSSTASTTPRRHQRRVESVVVVGHTAAAAQYLRDRTKCLTESVGQVALGTQSAALATAALRCTVVCRLRPYNSFNRFVMSQSRLE